MAPLGVKGLTSMIVFGSVCLCDSSFLVRLFRFVFFSVINFRFSFVCFAPVKRSAAKVVSEMTF